MKGGKAKEDDDDDLDQLLRKERMKEQERKDATKTVEVEEKLLVSGVCFPINLDIITITSQRLSENTYLMY